jgi:FMN-dependent oxidoreductase (nitrilotriacetate monooxygenase family)
METSQNQRQMSLLVFMAPVGYQTAAWRDPHSRVEDLYGLALPQAIARRVEAAKIHALFLADWLSFEETGRNPDQTGYEPFTTLGALAASTSKIGLIGTAATTFIQPYHLARYFSQLDWLSNGRIGWNIVTGTTGHENFNVALPPRHERYARAYEYMEVVTGLWDAWCDDAVKNDRARGVWADRSRISALGHQGEQYKVDGPLLVPRSPQGWPVLVQAGSSDSGKDFAARYAEVVFTATPTLNAAQAFYSDLKARTRAGGRSDSDIRVHPGMMPIIGDSEADARRIHDELIDLVDDSEGFTRVSDMLLNVDLSGLDWHDRIPADRLLAPDVAMKTRDANSRYDYFYDLALSKRYSVRELLREIMKSAGHSVALGSAEQVADHMKRWFEEGAADGFAVLPPTMPVGLDRFLDEVVPILQARGLFRTEYVEGTLRDNLGFKRPASRE